MPSAFCFLLKTNLFSVYNSKWRKQINSKGLLTNIKIIFLIWNSKCKHTIKKFIHSYLLILKQQTWKCKRKYILCQFWNTLAMSIFQTLGQKLKVLLSIICGTKINLEWITPLFFDLSSLSPLCLTHPLTLKFFQPLENWINR